MRGQRRWRGERDVLHNPITETRDTCRNTFRLGLGLGHKGQARRARRVRRVGGGDGRDGRDGRDREGDLVVGIRGTDGREVKSRCRGCSGCRGCAKGGQLGFEMGDAGVEWFDDGFDEL